MKGQRFSSDIPAALAGQRVDRVVSMLTNVSRREASELVNSSYITLAGQLVGKPSLRVEEGALIEIFLPEIDTSLKPDASVSLDIFYEDEHLLVVNKPAGLVVHPGAGAPIPTLAHGLLAHFPDVAGVGDPERPGIVHRLDKETSGLLAVARTPVAYESLKSQLSERSVQRVYATVVEGHFEAASGVVDAPLGRSLKSPTRQAVIASGRPARTRYAVLEQFASGYSLLECRLDTGRTHQIRVHLASIDHPVLGDVAYNASPFSGLSRFFLHAKYLSFVHPYTEEVVEFSCPLPVELQEALQKIETSV